MTVRLRPIARLGNRASGHGGSLSVAGSRFAWFNTLERRADDGSTKVIGPSGLNADARDRLSAPRPSLAGLALAKLGLGLGLDGVVNVLIWVTGSLTILSAVAYFWGWLRHMMSYEPAPPEPQPRRRSRAERASRSEVQTP